VISIKTTERNGSVVAAVSVLPEQEIVLITNKATLVRTRVSEISVVGRNTQGVKLINVGKGEQVVGLAVVDIEEELDDELEGVIDGEVIDNNSASENGEATSESGDAADQTPAE
ncbi:MAG: DNA gyrase C-terminal beta-propeller domain-containing protein, partial [Thiomicrorhabdus sp.]|nr:DNA gyrase C-terminal beta-propeller domain-containing protein [Thiomicrorhabdus sp.]